MRIKITYNNEIKKINPPKDYTALVDYAKRTFENLPGKFEFYYQDKDGDIISIGNNDEWQFELSSYEQENQNKADAF